VLSFPFLYLSGFLAKWYLLSPIPALRCNRGIKETPNTDFFGTTLFEIFEEPHSVNGANFLEKTVWSKGNEALVALIREKRLAAGLNQTQVAKALGQRQTWMSHLESGDRRVDVIEFVKLAETIGFDAADELRKLIPKILSE